MPKLELLPEGRGMETGEYSALSYCQGFNTANNVAKNPIGDKLEKIEIYKFLIPQQTCCNCKRIQSLVKIKEILAMKKCL